MRNYQAEIGQNISFSLLPSSNYIELKFDAPQDGPFKGWTIQPLIKPCKVSGNNNYYKLILIVAVPLGH